MNLEELNTTFPEVKDFDRLFWVTKQGEWSVSYQGCFANTSHPLGDNRVNCGTIQIGQYWYQGMTDGKKTRYHLI